MSGSDVSDSAFVWILCSVMVLFACSQALVYAVKSWKEAKRLGVEQKTLMAVVKNSILMSLVPVIPIVICMAVLATSLGMAIPWLRLSVIGSPTPELLGANTGAAAVGETLGANMTAKGICAAFIGMGLIGTSFAVLSIVAVKPMSMAIDKVKQKDSVWMGIFAAAAFIGMMVTMLVSVSSANKTALMVAAISILASCGISLLSKRIQWMKDFVMVFAMLIGMGGAFALSAMGM